MRPVFEFFINTHVSLYIVWYAFWYELTEASLYVGLSQLLVPSVLLFSTACIVGLYTTVSQKNYRHGISTLQGPLEYLIGLIGCGALAGVGIWYFLYTIAPELSVVGWLAVGYIVVSWSVRVCISRFSQNRQNFSNSNQTLEEIADILSYATIPGFTLFAGYVGRDILSVLGVVWLEWVLIISTLGFIWYEGNKLLVKYKIVSVSPSTFGLLCLPYVLPVLLLAISDFIIKFV